MAPTNPRREKISLAPAHRDEHHHADHANGPGIKANDAIQHAGSGKTSRRAKTVANLRRTRQIVSKGDGVIISAGADLLKALSALETGTRIELNSRTEPDESRELILKID